MIVLTTPEPTVRPPSREFCPYFLVFLAYLVGFYTPKRGLLSILFILFKNFYLI